MKKEIVTTFILAFSAAVALNGMTILQRTFRIVPAGAKPKWPHGIYTLTNNGTNTFDPNDPVVKSPSTYDYIRGYRVRGIYWTDIQPDNWDGNNDPVSDSNHFDFSKIDAWVAGCKAAGKHMGISIGLNRNAPRWLYARGVYKQTIDHDDNSLNGALFDEPLPWDPIYQQFLFRLIDQLAARYDLEPTIDYWLMTGFQQRVENRLINNVDGSGTYTDGVLSTFTHNGVDYGVLTSNTAHFLSSDSGLFVNDDAQQYFRGSTAILSTFPNDGAPAAITDTQVYLSRTPFQSGSGLAFNILKRYPGAGDQKKVNDYAISLGYNDTSPAKNELWPTGDPFATTWPGPSNHYAVPGFACVRAYMPAVKGILQYWHDRFPHTTVVITNQSPFADAQPYTSWATKQAAMIKNWVQQYQLGGYMTASLYAICQADYTNSIPDVPTPKGDQAIFALTNDDVYKGGKCGDGTTNPPASHLQRILDLCEASLEHGNDYLEPYYPDAVTSDATERAAWREQLARFPTPPPITPTPTPTP